MMPSHGVVVDDLICVDTWLSRLVPASTKFFFLTHLHADHTVGLTSTWSRGVIYTSPLNVKLLRHLRGVTPHLVQPLALERTHLLAESDGAELNVTLYDAHHVPGAVMFHFTGCVGSVLITGDFRAEKTMLAIFSNLSVDRLFLDNTYFYHECDFPSRQEVIARLIGFLQSKPDHHIYIGTKVLGKEHVLVRIAQSLNENICISSEKLSLFKLLRLPDVFTTDANKSRIFAVRQESLTRSFLHGENQRRPTLGVILSALYHGWRDGPYSMANNYNLFVFEYSDHSSYQELNQFVEAIKPMKVFPLISKTEGGGFMRQRKQFLESRVDLSPLDPYLNHCEAVTRTYNLQELVTAGHHKRPLRRFSSLLRPYRGHKGVQYATSSSSSSSSLVCGKDKMPFQRAAQRLASVVEKDSITHDSMSVIEQTLSELDILLNEIFTRYKIQN